MQAPPEPMGSGGQAEGGPAGRRPQKAGRRRAKRLGEREALPPGGQRGAGAHVTPTSRAGHTDPQQTEGFRKRWFTMDDRRLMYFKDPLDAFARGEVFIGSRESGYTVLDRLPPATQGHHWPHGITIVTPERRFLLACETEPEQRAWLDAFRKVVDRPMLPQEYAVEAHFKHKP